MKRTADMPYMLYHVHRRTGERVPFEARQADDTFGASGKIDLRGVICEYSYVEDVGGGNLASPENAMMKQQGTKDRTAAPTTWRNQMVVAFALMAVIPMLTFIYFLCSYVTPNVVTRENVLLIVLLNLILAIAGFVTATRVLRSLWAFRQHVEAITQGDLSRSLPPHPDPEINRIVQSIQIITDQLRRDRERITDLSAQMEKQVDERTEQFKTAARTAQESEARWRSLLENAPAVITTTDRQGKILFINYPGVSAQYAVGRSALDFILPEYRETMADSMRRAFEKGESSQCEIMGKGVGQTTAWYRTYVCPVRSGDTITAAMFVASDVTLQKQTEQALRQSEQRYRDLVENLGEVVYLADNTGAIVYVSPSIERLIGWTPSEMVGKSFRQFVDRGDLGQVAARIEGTAGHTEAVELRVVTKSGETRWIRVTTKPVTEGARLVGMQGIAVDITESRRMDERLHYERGFSDRLLRSSTDGIMVIDRELRCTVWNPGMERMWGKTEAECLGKCALDVFPFLKETGEDQLFRAVLLGDSFEAKDRYYKAPETGEEGYYEASYSPLSDEAGNIIGCLGFVRDVTTRRRAEGELKESREQLRALAARMESVREEERTRMSREIHDEMGHGLTTLKMELAQLRKRIIGAGAGMLAIRGTLAKSIEEMSGLVDQTIQSVRRIATELRPGVLDHLGVTAAIEWLAQDFEKRTGIVCRAILPQQEMNVNEKQSTGLFRIAQEILTNAAKHSRATEVNIGLQEEEGKLVLAVHDNGQGFSKRSLFDTQSLGILGMEERARLLGGELEIRGEKKKGTTVVVRIPLRANL